MKRKISPDAANVRRLEPNFKDNDMRSTLSARQRNRLLNDQLGRAYFDYVMATDHLELLEDREERWRLDAKEYAKYQQVCARIKEQFQ